MSVKVVNMIPNSMSNETQRDAEPNITATFLDPARIAASVFTPDPAGSGNAPIYLSSDGGDTWSLNVVLPGGNKTNDTTLRFAGPSNVLYAGILRVDNGNLEILRKATFTAPGLMTTLLSKTNDDQPYIEGAVVMAGSGAGSDRVYVGENDFGATMGHTATIDLSLDAATAPPPAGFGTHSVETRATFGQDGPPIRPCLHLDGTVYGLYLGWRSSTTMDVVVVRDNNWAAGGSPFTSLTDPSDGLAGRLVIAGATKPSAFGGLLGTQRVGSQNAIAVDPRNSSIVYIAWADGATSAAQTLHVRRSTDRGVTWSTSDIRTIPTATNPALAINRHGTVGFLFQQLHNPGGGNKWQTRIQTWGANLGSVTDTTLADVPDANGSYAGANPIGDYAGLISVGDNFYGIFSGNNTPDLSNFPNGVAYQRNHDFAAHTLTDLGGAPVAVSIDPFFFKLTTVETADDFYVRDWTDSPTSGDNGVEPSTHSQFYVSSDVWNRRGTLPGMFPSDQPQNEDAGNGLGNIGDNWAFARIRRNVPSATGPQPVTAHFLVSKFGTGSAYVDSSSMDPDVTFIDPDPTVVFAAADVGPTITTPVQWHLGALASTHLCLAVEVSAPNDSFVPPSLVGNTPGWPTTDLRIVNDNNKAQRNMSLSTTPARGAGSSDCVFALINNAATFTRDLQLRYSTDAAVAELFKGAAIEVIGGKEIKLGIQGEIVLPGMQPGEKRWIGLRFPSVKGKGGQVLVVSFDEVFEGLALNGFAMGARLGTSGNVIREKLQRHHGGFGRLAAFGVEVAEESVELAGRLLRRKKIPATSYLSFAKTQQKGLAASLKDLTSLTGGDPFRVDGALRSLRAALANGSADDVAVCHDCVLSRVDATLTLHQLKSGDVSDILHTVRWQRDLFRQSDRLAGLEPATDILERSDAFIQGYGVREVANRDYPKLMSILLRPLSTAAEQLKDTTLVGLVTVIEKNLGGLRPLQKAHRDYLLRLQVVRAEHSR
jgi:hypothetical protein